MSLNTQKTVIVLGANGRIGQATMQAFASAGWDVVAQARRPIESLPARARQIGIDMSNTTALANAAANASVVVYAVNPLYTEWDEKLLPLARQGMDLAERLGALFMLPGNVYAFGANMPERLLETTVPRPTTKKGEQRAALEDEMQSRIQTGLRSVVIRAGDFFGGGTGNWFDQSIVKSIRSQKLVYPGPLDRIHAWAYLPDLARAFVGLAELDRQGTLKAPVTRHATKAASTVIGTFKKIHFVGHNVSGETFLASIERAAAALGIAAPGSLRRSTLPWSVIGIGGVFNPMWRELARMAYLWRVPHAVESIAFADLLPDFETTPLDTALEASLRALGYGMESRPTAPPLVRVAV